MLPEDDRVRLRHMLDAARKAARLAARRAREELDAEDDPLADALVRLISVIGEAASKVSPGTCSELDGIPWPDIVGMRNRLIHAYFDINLDILWATVQDSLPSLSVLGICSGRRHRSVKFGLSSAGQPGAARG